MGGGQIAYVLPFFLGKKGKHINTIPRKSQEKDNPRKSQEKDNPVKFFFMCLLVYWFFFPVLNFPSHTQTLENVARKISRQISPTPLAEKNGEIFHVRTSAG